MYLCMGIIIVMLYIQNNNRLLRSFIQYIKEQIIYIRTNMGRYNISLLVEFQRSTKHAYCSGVAL